MPPINGRRIGHTVLLGGRTFVKPVTEEVKWLNLETQTVSVTVTDAITKSGVKLNVDAIMQVKIRSDNNGLLAAAEQLLDKSDSDITQIALRNLEGHIRSACAQLQIEEINSDRAKLASRIQEEAVPDLAKLGLEVTTFTVKDISDRSGYLDALGKKRVAEVLRDAAVGQAEAQRDTQIKVAQAKRDQEAAAAQALDSELRIAKINAEASGKTREASQQAVIAEATKDRDVRIENARGETTKAKAQADVQYDIQQASSQQQLAEQQRLLAAKQAETEKERRRQTVVVPAEAQAASVAAAAAGAKEATLREAEAKAESIRLVGIAEANAILVKGQAEAEALKLKAEAYLEFGDAALADRLGTLMPAIAKEFAGAFQNTEKIIILEGNGANGEMGNSMASWLAKAMATVPELVQGMTGKSVPQMIEEISTAARATKSSK